MEREKKRAKKKKKTMKKIDIDHKERRTDR